MIVSNRESGDGGAIAASRLAGALAGQGAEVMRIVECPDDQPHPWSTRVLTVRIRERAIAEGIGRISWTWGMRWLRGRLRAKALSILADTRPDVINVHNIHGATWDLELVETCLEFAPTVWTLHDMWSFTGRCVFSRECRKFLTGCDHTCPTSDEYPALAPELIRRAWEWRQKLLQGRPDLVAVSPSRWLAEQARAGLWRDHPVEVIPNGLPLDIYRPLPRHWARRALQLPTEGPVVLVAAFAVTDPRKGADLLAHVLGALRWPSVTVVTMGYGRLSVHTPGLRMVPLGYVDHERTRVLVYNAADLLVHAAVADNFPNTIAEAIACGTPCVAFPVGGIPELVIPGKTGWLAPEISAEALAETLSAALESIMTDGQNLRRTCRAFAKTHLDVRIQAHRYLDLFYRVCGKPPEAPHEVEPRLHRPV